MEEAKMKAKFAVVSAIVPPFRRFGWKGTLTCGEQKIFSWFVFPNEPWPPDAFAEARKYGLEIESLQRGEVSAEI